MVNNEIKSYQRSGTERIVRGYVNPFNEINPLPLNKRFFKDDEQFENGIMGLNFVAELVHGYEYGDESTLDTLPFETEGRQIILPFPPESPKSGIGIVGPENNSLWYRLKATVTDTWLKDRVSLRFKAEDRSTVYVNGQPAFSHGNGFTEADGDISAFLQPGENEIIIHTLDDHSDPLIPKGKQGWAKARSITFPEGCNYYPASGITGPLYLIRRPEIGFDFFRHDPVLNLEGGQSYLNVSFQMRGMEKSSSPTAMAGKRIRTEIFYKGKLDTISDIEADASLKHSIPLTKTHPWDPREDEPALYDVIYTLYDANDYTVFDRVDSQFGLVNMEVRNGENPGVFFNNERVRIPAVLDQGYNIWDLYTRTPKEVDDDLTFMRDLGILMVRTHMWVQPEYVAYQYMKRGVIFSGEIPNWNGDESQWGYIQRLRQIQHETVHQLYNYTAFRFLVGLNEAEDNLHPQATDVIAEDMRKLVGDSRIRINITGFPHRDFGHPGAEDQVYSVHVYDHNPWTLLKRLRTLAHRGQSLPQDMMWMLGEGLGVRTEDYPKTVDAALNNPFLDWVYGTGIEIPTSEAESLELMSLLWQSIGSNPKIDIAVWTQLRSTPPEKNGIASIKNRERLSQILYMYAIANDLAKPFMLRSVVQKMDEWLIRVLSDHLDKVLSRTGILRSPKPS